MINRFKKGHIPWNTGKKLSMQHRKKLSESHKGNSSGMLGKYHSLESRKKMSAKAKGRIVTLEARKKMSRSRLGEKNWKWKGGKLKCNECGKALLVYKNKTGKCWNCFIKNGRTPWNKGKTLHYNVWNKGLTGYSAGKQNPRWKGGITPEVMKTRNSLKYKEWRTAIFERDNYTCRICNKWGGKLHADHIVPFSFIWKTLKIRTYEDALDAKSLWNMDNGRTLCVGCHEMTETYLSGAKDYIGHITDFNIELVSE